MTGILLFKVSLVSSIKDAYTLAAVVVAKNALQTQNLHQTTLLRQHFHMV